MSSTDFASGPETVDVRLRPSRRAVQWVYLLHFVPLMLLAFASRPGTLMVFVAAGIGLSWFWLRRHAAFGFGPKAIVRLVWQPNLGWQLHDASGRVQRARLQKTTTLGRQILVLNFKPDGAPVRTRVLAGGELPDEPLRRLRARLLSPEAMQDASGDGPQA